MVDTIEGRTKIKKTHQRHFLAVSGIVDVGHDLQQSRFSGVMSTVR
jgi:hypothetical protein